MRTAVFIYDNFVQFEVVLSCLFMKTKSEVVTVSLDGGAHRSNEGFPTLSDMKLSDLELGSVDLFLIPGGWEKFIGNKEELHSALRELNDRGKVIAAICGAPLQLARAGLLKGKRYTCSVSEENPEAFEGAIFVEENVVVDGNIVTAQPNGYVDMALVLGKMFDIYEDEADYLETVRVFREFKRQ